MAGIGEASAIVGLVQVGFSLATALNTYVSDVSDAGDDISSLISDIEATFGQLRDLGKLIEKNEKTKAWSEDGLRNAKKCVTDCEKSITKLRKLLKKSTASATSEEVNRDDIDVSKLERVLWPFIKPQVEVRRRELQRIKQDIMIAYSSYMTQVGTDAEREKYTDDLPRLQRTRALARRQVREAKERRRRQVSSHQRKGHHRPSVPVQLPPGDVLPETPWGFDRMGVPYQLFGPGAGLSDSERGSALDDDEAIIYANIDDLERDFKAWNTEEEERRAWKEAERKVLQEDAVKNWKEQQLLEVKIRREKIDEERSSLQAELIKQRVAPQQIENIINHVHPQEQVNSEIHLLGLNPSSDKASSIATADGLLKDKNPRRWSIWSRAKPSSSHESSVSSTLVNQSRQISVPDVLKDPTADGGIAPLEASYFQRSSGELPSVKCFDFEIPDQWLLNSLIKRQEAIAQNPKKVNPIWKEFSQLPKDYRHAIGRRVSEKTEYGTANATWVLFHLECIFEKRRPRMFVRGKPERVVGVYLVLKQNKKPRDRSEERQDYERGIDYRDIDIGIPRDEDERRGSPRPFRPRRHSSKNVYEPRHSQVYLTKETPRSRNRQPAGENYNFAYQAENYDGYDDFHELERERNLNHRPVFLPQLQRSSRDRNRIPNAPGPGNLQKTVSFAETPVPPVGYPYTQFNALYGISSPLDQRPSSPRRSRNRSRSPRALRRSGTDESYRSSDSFVFPVRTNNFPGYTVHEGTGRPGQRQLRVIEEILEDSDVSISSEGSDDDVLSRRPRRQPRETDQELLDKTLKEYINPSQPLEGNANPESSMMATKDAAASGGESSSMVLPTADPSSSGRNQPSVEDDHVNVES